MSDPTTPGTPANDSWTTILWIGVVGVLLAMVVDGSGGPRPFTTKITPPTTKTLPTPARTK